MTIARAIRLLLAFASALIVIWSFIDVGARVVSNWRSGHQRPITLTILHWGDTAEDNIVASLVSRYMEENPSVRIVRINAGGDFRTKLKTMMAAGAPPDLFYLPPDLLPEMAQLKLIHPIDELVEQDRADDDAKWFDDFYPVLIDAFRYDADAERTGQGPLFGLPKDFTTAVFYVNVDLFEKAGVPVPYDGWTWNEFEDACRKITALNGRREFVGRRIFGGHFMIWPDTLRQIIWTFGGDFFGENFSDVTLDQPQAQEALEMIVRTRLDDETVFNATGIAKDGGQEFFTGNIGCLGPVGRWMVPRFSHITSFRWDVVPVPYKEKQYQSSQIFLTAWSMSSQTSHRDESWKLMKYLCSGEGAIEQSRLGLAIPPLKSVANSPDFLSPPALPAHRSDIFLDAIRYARVQQTPREAEWGRAVETHVTSAIQLGDATTMQAAQRIENEWLEALNSPLRQRDWGAMRWNWIIAITLAVLTTAIALTWWKARQEKLGALDRAHERAGFMFIAPWLIGFVALTAGPMVVSLLLSFTKWSAMTPMSHAEAVGIANYLEMAQDKNFTQSLKVTFYYVVLAVPVTQVAALAVALLMNSQVRGISIFRTIYFVPSVVSGVALAVLWLQIFNNDYGILNEMLRPILAPLGMRPPDWFGRSAHTWAIPGFVIMSLWGVGGGMIIYLAGLKGIPSSLYEAAIIDGAGAWDRLCSVTLPMLSPLIFFNVVMGIIGSFQVFTQAYVMTGGGPNNATLFYVLNLYRHAFEFHNMGYASALAWVLFVIVLIFTLLIFRGSRSLVYYEGLKR